MLPTGSSLVTVGRHLDFGRKALITLEHLYELILG